MITNASLNESNNWTDAQSSLYFDFVMATTADPLIRTNRLWNKKAWIELGYYDEDCMELKGLEAVTLFCGYGSEALSWLLSMCTDYQIALVLEVNPFTEDIKYHHTDPQKLEEYYKRRGFVDFSFPVLSEISNPKPKRKSLIRRPR